MKVLFLGSGPSVSLPILSCTEPTCECCKLARQDPLDKNNRFNTSILIQTDDNRHLLVDCGKTFYAAARRHIYQPNRLVTKLDAVMITHGHADAMLGIDDLRHYTRNRDPKDGPLVVHCDSDTMSVIKSTFPYLVDTKTATGSGQVAEIKFNNGLMARQPIIIAGLEIIPFHVEHGIKPDSSPFYCLAFIIEKRMVYMSDVSRVTEQDYQFILDNTMVIDLLVVDCLFKDRDMQSHVGWPGARQIIKRLNPRRALLVGMDHCIEHDHFNSILSGEFGESVQLAFDGLEVDL